MGKKLLVISCILGMVAGAAYAMDSSDLGQVTFQNETGSDVQMLFMSPTDSDSMGPNILAADQVLKDGDSIDYEVDYPDSPFQFELTAQDADGNNFELKGFSISDGKQSTVRLAKKSSGESAQDFPTATVTITNNTGNELDYLFISPSDSDAWGANLQNTDSGLSDGDTQTFAIPVGTEKVKYNVRAIDSNQNEYSIDMDVDPSSDLPVEASIEAGDMESDN